VDHANELWMTSTGIGTEKGKDSFSLGSFANEDKLQSHQLHGGRRRGGRSIAGACVTPKRGAKRGSICHVSGKGGRAGYQWQWFSREEGKKSRKSLSRRNGVASYGSANDHGPFAMGASEGKKNPKKDLHGPGPL